MKTPYRYTKAGFPLWQRWETIAVLTYCICALSYFATAHPLEGKSGHHFLGYKVNCGGYVGIAVAATDYLLLVENKPLKPKLFNQSACEVVK